MDKQTIEDNGDDCTCVLANYRSPQSDQHESRGDLFAYLTSHLQVATDHNRSIN